MTLLLDNTTLIVMLISVMVSMTGFFLVEIHRGRKKYEEAKKQYE